MAPFDKREGIVDHVAENIKISVPRKSIIEKRGPRPHFNQGHTKYQSGIVPSNVRVTGLHSILQISDGLDLWGRRQQHLNRVPVLVIQKSIIVTPRRSAENNDPLRITTVHKTIFPKNGIQRGQITLVL